MRASQCNKNRLPNRREYLAVKIIIIHASIRVYSFDGLELNNLQYYDLKNEYIYKLYLLFYKVINCKNK